MTAGTNACPICNPDLEKAILALPNIDEIPHCFLQNLHQAVFLCPIANTNGHACADARPDTSYQFIPCSEVGKSFLALFTSADRLGQWQSGTPCPHIHLSLADAIVAAQKAGLQGLVLNPGTDHHMRLPREAFTKVLAVSPRQPRQETSTDDTELEIGPGEEMIVSTPDPVPPELFLYELTRVLRTVQGLREAYLFELAWGKTAGELVLGIVTVVDSVPGRVEAALDQISPEARQAAHGFDHFDLMILDDPALIEVVSSTVPSLLTAVKPS